MSIDIEYLLKVSKLVKVIILKIDKYQFFIMQGYLFLQLLLMIVFS